MTDIQTILGNLTGGFWASAAFGACLESGLLDAASKSSLDEIVQETGLRPQVVRALLDVMTELGLVKFDRGRWTTHPELRALLEHDIQREITQNMLRADWLIASHLYDGAKHDNPLLGTWAFDDPEIVDVRGRSARYVIPLFRNEFFAAVPGFNESLEAAQATFLDVGVGAGWLAIGFAETYPGLRVVGIDADAQAVEAAQANVLEAELTSRIEVRELAAQALSETDAYDVAWVPLTFFDGESASASLKSVCNALKPGGRVFTLVTVPPDDKMARAIVGLRDAISGAVLRSQEETLKALESAGFAAPAAMPAVAGVPFRLLWAQKPT